MDRTRPVRIAYRFRALVRVAVEAPGKFAVVNSASAGSLLAIPKLMVGTCVWFRSHTSACVNSIPKLRLCDSRTQFSVSCATLVEASRELMLALAAAALVRNCPVPQQAPFMLRWKPAWSATDVPLYIEGLISVENRVAPPVAPKKRRSFTRFVLSVERSEPWYAKRLESCTPWIGKPGKATSRLFSVSGSESSLFIV